MSVAEWSRVYGDIESGALSYPWKLFVSDGCQVGYAYPGEDDPGRPMKKTAQWAANFDLSAMEIRHDTGFRGAMTGSTHLHKIVRGGAKLPEAEGGRWVSVAAHSGKYPSVISSIRPMPRCRNSVGLLNSERVRTGRPQRD